MAAPIRIFAKSDNFLKKFSQLTRDSLPLLAVQNKHLAFHKERKIATKQLNSFQICVDIVRKYDYENYLCALLLHEPARTASFVIRAFNVEISQVRDLVSTSAIGEMRMQFWKNTLDQTFLDKPPEQPVAQELAKILKKVKLTKSWFSRLISSRESLLNDKPFHTVTDLENYCDNAVVPVYFLILQAFGVTSVHCDHIASHLGKCQGICNIIRGIPYNLSQRRLYFPLELISKHKISQEALFHGDLNNLSDAVFDLSSVAHQHLNKARQLGNDMPRDVPKNVKSIFLPAVSCRSYLENLEKTNFDVFHSRNQARNNWLPVLLWSHKLLKKF